MLDRPKGLCVKTAVMIQIRRLLWLILPMANSANVISLCCHHLLSALASVLTLALASLLFVYSTPGDMVDASEFISGIYTGIHPPLMHCQGN